MLHTIRLWAFAFVLCFISLHQSQVLQAQSLPGAWQIQPLKDFIYGEDISFSFADSLHGYVGNGGGWYKTSNGGRNWEPLTNWIGLSMNPFQQVRAEYLSTPTPNTFFAHVYDGSNTFYTTIVSTDWGKTFDYRDTRLLFDHMNYWQMITPSYGLAVFIGGENLSITRDSAYSYSAVGDYDSILSFALIKMQRSTSGSFLAWSDTSHYTFSVPSITGMTTLVTDNGARSWEHYFSPFPEFEHYGLFGELTYLKGTPYVWMNPNQPSLAPHFVPTGFFSSTDYGKSWSVNSNYPARIKAICPISKDKIWMSVSRHGKIGYSPEAITDMLVYSSDGGKTWAEDSISAIGLDIIKMQFTDSTHGWALGISRQQGSPQAAFILRFDPTLSLSVSASPSDHSDARIFPNPATDRITIEDQRPARDGLQGRGLLEVYNCLGQRIISQEWNGAALTSLNVASLPIGVYQLRLQYGARKEVLRFQKQ